MTSCQVTSIAQEFTPGEQRELEWQKVNPSEDCGELTATVTGLEPDSAYVFSVDAVRPGGHLSERRPYRCCRPLLSRAHALTVVAVAAGLPPVCYAPVRE
ncbi:fibronectin type III domain-containing protein [Actinoplanes sp. NPDC004185]